MSKRVFLTFFDGSRSPTNLAETIKKWGNFDHFVQRLITLEKSLDDFPEPLTLTGATDMGLNFFIKGRIRWVLKELDNSTRDSYTQST